MKTIISRIAIANICLFYSLTIYAGQHTFIDGDYTWTSSTKNSRYDVSKVPENWKSPINYYEGKIYERLEIISKPSDLPITAQFCFWQSGREGCSGQSPKLPKSGTLYYINERSPSQFSKIRGGGVNWTNMHDGLVAQHMFKSPDKGGNLVATSACGSHCWGSDVGDHVPVPYNITMIVTEKGSEFIRPAGWEDCPAEVCGTGSAVGIDMGNGWYMTQESWNKINSAYDKNSNNIIVTGYPAKTIEIIEIISAQGQMIYKQNLNLTADISEMIIALSSKTKLPSSGICFCILASKAKRFSSRLSVIP